MSDVLPLAAHAPDAESTRLRMLFERPSIYARRRALYDDPFDPFITRLLGAASSLGFERVVPVALKWSREYVDEWRRAGASYGIDVMPANCPLWRPGGARQIVALPKE